MISWQGIITILTFLLMIYISWRWFLGEAIIPTERTELQKMCDERGI